MRVFSTCHGTPLAVPSVSSRADASDTRQRASTLFSEHLLAPGVPASDPRYRRALFHLLASETSCYRYWGQGTWTGYGAELARRASQAASSAA